MAAIFQIRRGTTNVSLTEGELYLHQGSGSLQFGSGSNNYNVLTLNTPVNGDVILTGNITASNAYFTGDVAISGNLFLGNNTGDNISVPGVFTTNLVPGGNGTLDLGTPGAKWKTIYAVSASIENISLPGSNIVSSSQQISDYNTFLEIGGDSVVSSSQQILDYNIFATTGSNTFRGNQIVTGSLMVSDGEFSIITGSGNVTSSLRFDHTQNDGVTLQLGHDDNGSFADHKLNVKVWAGGVYTDFIRNGVTYNILNVEAFDNSNIYIYRDTRLYNKSLVIDNNLTVKDDTEITGSLTVVDGEFSVTSGSGYLTSSIGFIHNTISPSQGSSVFEVRHINSEYSENFAVKLFADDFIAKMQYEKDGSTIDILRTNLAGDLHLTRDTRLFGTDLTIDGTLQLTGSLSSANSANFLGDVTASIFTGSFIGDGSGLSGVTANEVEYEDVLNKPTLVSGSSQIISILNPLNNFSASVTSSLESIYQTTGSLNDFSASVTASLESIYQTTASLNEFTTSQLSKDDTLANYTASVENRLTEIGVVSGSLISTASAHNTSITELNNWSGSAKIQIYELENKSASVDTSLSNIHSYTSSLKTAIELTGSNVVVLGDLTVKGTTTQIDSTTIQLGDNIIELNGSSAANGGLLVKDVTNPNTISGSLLWDATNDYWKAGALGNESKVLLADGDNVFTSSLQLTEINNTTASLNQTTESLNLFSASVTASLESIYQTTASLNLFSASVTASLKSIYQTTASLNAYTQSVNSDLASLHQTTASLNLFSASVTASLESIYQTTASLNDFSASVTASLEAIYQTTSSLNDFSASVTASLEAIYQTTASLNDFSASVTTSLESIYQTTASLNLYTQSVNNDLVSLHQTTASLNEFSASVTSSLEAIYQTTTSLNLFSASVTSSLESLYQTTSSLNDFSASVTASLEVIYQTTASLNDFSASVTASLESIYQTTASLNDFSASVTASLEAIYQTTASLNDFSASVTSSLESIYQTTASLNTFTSSQLAQNETLSQVTASIHQFTSSLNSYTGATEIRLDELEYTASISIGAGLVNEFVKINEFTASAKISIDNLNTFTSSFSESVSASIAGLASASGYINYVTNSIEQLTGIEVADFDNNVAVTFINGTLKFIFGTPAIPTSIATSLSGFLVDRFNNVNDAYIVNGTWSNQGYTLVSASLYEGSTLLTQVGSGTSLSFSTTTSGSHTYRLEYTASSPLDGTLFTTSTTTTGTISKSNPASPTLTLTPTVQLGASSNQIEQGATGSISFTSASADPSNSWNLVNTTTNVSTPYFVTGSATGSTSISITATANYESPIGDNIPDLTTTSTATTTYTKIRSLRHGASDVTSFTIGELENIGVWDTTLGGSIGTIIKGTTNPSGQSVTISWSGDKFHYIVFDSSRSNLSNITTSGFGVLGQFSVTTVGQYKVYKTNTLQAGGAGSSITYTLT